MNLKFHIGTAGPYPRAALDFLADRGTSTNAIFFVTTNAPGGTFLITNGTTRNYLVTGNDPGTTWREPTFDDSGWSNGLAELGYGDREPPDSRPERTVINPAPSLEAATCFRKGFPVRDPADFTNLIVHLLRDAGGVVYLNGIEVFRDNMPTGVVFHTTLAASEPFDDGTRYVSTNVSPARLVTGDNVIAVEIHPSLPVLYQTADLSFDLMLWGQPGEPALTVTRVGTTEFDIAWPFPSTSYSLESKPHLDASAWTPVPEPDHPTNGFHHVTVSSAGDARFFRLHRP